MSATPVAHVKGVVQQRHLASLQGHPVIKLTTKGSDSNSKDASRRQRGDIAGRDANGPQVPTEKGGESCWRNASV
jgi:hypothetical protein